MLRDPDVPATGNPDGDINIVEWFDYNCPYCRKIAPEIRQVVQDDGKVRLVLKAGRSSARFRSSGRGWRWRRSIRTSSSPRMRR